MTTADLTFSVVVNTTDRAAALQTLLRALEQQSYPHFEVVVVVGPTRDNTLEILAPYASRLRVVRCPEANLGISRNLGLAAAQGDVVAYIDDDAVPCRTWLEQFAWLFADPDLDATGGTVFLVDPVRTDIQFRLGLFSSLAEAADVRSSWLDQLTADRLARFSAPRMMGTNMAFRREALLAVGGFDEYYEWVFDESDLCLRLATAGKLVHPVHEAAVYHVPASSRNRQLTKSTARWYIQTKAGLYFTLQHGRRMRERWRAIGLRCLYLMHGRWIWGYNYYKAGNITRARLLRMWAEEVGAWATAIPAGLFTRPHVMAQPQPSAPHRMMFQ